MVFAFGCGRQANGSRVHEAGADRKVHIQVGAGPFDELTILRGSDGRFVVAGVCLFPEDTRIDVSVSDSAGVLLGHSQALVQHALIQTLPLGPEGAPARPARYVVRLTATFAPGLQSEPVMREVGNGKQYQGEGMTRTRQGRLAYDRSFEVKL